MRYLFEMSKMYVENVPIILLKSVKTLFENSVSSRVKAFSTLMISSCFLLRAKSKYYFWPLYKRHLNFSSIESTKAGLFLKGVFKILSME